jgi:hypothetical protein
MKYQVSLKTENSTNIFNTTVEADRVGQATTSAMIQFLKTTKLHGDLVLFKVIDKDGITVLNQFKE